MQNPDNPHSKVYEAADMLEKFATMFKEHPEELIEAAASPAMFRDSIAGYLYHLSGLLRQEESQGSRDGDTSVESS